MPTEPLSSNREAERAVLAACMLGDDGLAEVCAVLDNPEVFVDHGHRRIFTAILALASKGASVSQITVADRMEGDIAANQKACIEVCNSEASWIAPRAHALIVAECAQRRETMRAAATIYHEAPGFDGDIAAHARDTFDRIAKGGPASNYLRLGEFLRSELADWIAAADKAAPSGFADIDAVTDGFFDGHLVIIGARPAVGKTAFALNLALKAARAGVTVAFFSLEMTRIELAARMLSTETGIRLSALRGEEMADGALIEQGIVALERLPLYIDDSPSASVTQMAASARRILSGAARRMVIIDYLQLVASTRVKAENRQVEVADISRALKIAAKDLSTPIITLAQLSRAVESRRDKQPLLSDLRESGAIEQDADVVMFLDRSMTDEELKMENRTRPDAGVAWLHVAKNRHGATGRIELAWDGEHVRFSDLYTRPDAAF